MQRGVHNQRVSFLSLLMPDLIQSRSSTHLDEVAVIVPMGTSESLYPLLLSNGKITFCYFSASY